MTIYLNHFFSFSQQKNGYYRIFQSPENENHKNLLLHNLGFRKTIIDNKNILYQRIGSDIVPISAKNLKIKLIDYFKQLTFENPPENFLVSEINDFLHQKSPIEQNENFDFHLTENLTAEEYHLYSQKVKYYYKKNFDKILLLAKLAEWNFIKTIDKRNTIAARAPVYYKNIIRNKYLIFIQKKPKLKNTDTFECWFGEYISDKQGGQFQPSNLQEITFNFELYKDFSLIEKYVCQPEVKSIKTATKH